MPCPVVSNYIEFFNCSLVLKLGKLLFREQTAAEKVKAKMKLQLAETGKITDVLVLILSASPIWNIFCRKLFPMLSKYGRSFTLINVL